MTINKQVLAIPDGIKIHVEHHVFDPSFETVILVNGALATTALFRQTIKYLSVSLNAICYDLPYAGQSRRHNESCDFILSKDNEVEILMCLVHHFEPEYLLSFSWGGVASLFALARSCASIRRAAIASFTPFLNEAMFDYVIRARDYIGAGEQIKAAQLINDTVGCYLPRIMKLHNYRYLTGLPRSEQNQVAFYINQTLETHSEQSLDEFRRIRCDLKFINGELDLYTTPADVRCLGEYVRHAEFATVPGAGHFLDLEGRAQLQHMRGLLLDFFGNVRR